MNKPNRRTRISVVGGSRATQEIREVAERTGELIGNRNAILVCGGMGGVMRAACRGARNAGGTTVGIVPTRDARDANSFVDIPVVTGMGDARNVAVALSGAGVVAINGRFGTMSEIALALNAGKPVAAIQVPVAEGMTEEDNIRSFPDAEPAVNWVFRRITSTDPK